MSKSKLRVFFVAPLAAFAFWATSQGPAQPRFEYNGFESFGYVICARKNLKRGSLLAPEDMEIRRLHEREFHPDSIWNPEMIKGRKAMIDIKKGETIHAIDFNVRRHDLPDWGLKKWPQVLPHDRYDRKTRIYNSARL